MRLLVVGFFLSAILQAQTLPPGPPAPVARYIPPATLETLIVKQVAPEYPAEAQASQIVGDVVLTVLLNEKGNLQRVKAIKGPAMLRAAAMNAVVQWRFRPYLRDGVAIAVQSEVIVHFPPP